MHRLRQSDRFRVRRLLALDPEAGTVTFDYKDYGDGARHKTMTLELAEFVRRLALHFLPERWVKIRHYGLLANRGRQERLARVQEVLAAAPPMPDSVPTLERTAHAGAEGHERLVCPHCGAAALVLVKTIPRPSARRPPWEDSS